METAKAPAASVVQARAAVKLTQTDKQLIAQMPGAEGAIRHIRAELAALRAETDPRFEANRRRYRRELRQALRSWHDKLPGGPT